MYLVTEASERVPVGLLNVLVLGGTQFMGRLVVERLLAGGHRVTMSNRGVTANPFGDSAAPIRPLTRSHLPSCPCASRVSAVGSCVADIPSTASKIVDECIGLFRCRQLATIG